MTHELSASSLAKLDAWLKSRRRWVVAAVLGLALLLRGVAYYELHESPVMDAHTLEQMDMKFFDDWARTMVDNGDVLVREPMHPLHGWHRAVAGKYFDRHPEKLGQPFAKLTREQQNVAAVEIWTEWYRGNQFHQEPLYAYFVAAVYAVWGAPDVRVVYVLQMLGGLLLVLLLYLCTLRLFGDLTAVATAVLGMLWGPLIHYEVTLLRTSLLSLAGVALLYVAQRAIDRRDGSGAAHIFKLFAFGCLIGLATALKSTFLVLGIGLLLVLFWPMRRQLVRVGCQAGAVAIGVILVLSPIWIRNSMVDASLFSMTSVGPVTFVGSNVPGHQPWMGWFPEYYAEDVARAMEASGGSLLGAVSATLGMYDNIGDYFALLFAKFEKLVYWHELANNTNFYYSCVHSTVLQILRFLVAASWVIPAAIVGCVLAFRRRRPVGLWVWYVVCTTAPMIVFYVLSRFRAPMIVGLMPFAAFAIVQVVDGLLAKSQRRATRSMVAVFAFVVLVFTLSRPFSHDLPLVTSDRFYGGVLTHYLPRMKTAEAEGDYPGILVIWEELFATRPPYIDSIGPGRPIADKYEYNMVDDVFRPAYGMCAQVSSRLGVPDTENHYGADFARLANAVAEYEIRHPK